MKVVIIGAGNVATILGMKIFVAGHSIEQIIGRSETEAADLAETLNASHTTNLLQINDSADVYIISINDDHLEELALTLRLENKLVAHTAGSVSMSVLKNTSNNYGVLYPLQSLRKQTTHLPDVPVLIDGNSSKAREELRAFANTWASQVIFASDSQRMKFHVAGVITSNFSNHLYALAEAYCKKEGVEFNVLLPIIKETATRLEEYAPSELQTGPAARGDVATIDKHLHLLTQHPALRKIYIKLTESIIENNKLLTTKF